MDCKIEIEHFQELDSTSSYLQRLSFSGKRPCTTDEWRVCSTDFQTAGRGQRGNAWTSVPGRNLLFSILFHPTIISAARQFVLAEIFSLAMVDFFRTLGVDTLIKWPNDIYAGNRKICGMLFENTVSGKVLESSIIGIGVNLNQKNFEPSIANPTSVALETGVETDKQAALAALLEILRSKYESVKTNGISFEELHSQYLSNLYRFGEYHHFQRLIPGTDPLNVSFADDTSENVIEARISNVKENGLLVLEDREGLEMEFAFKEVKFLL